MDSRHHNDLLRRKDGRLHALMYVCNRLGHKDLHIILIIYILDLVYAVGLGRAGGDAGNQQDECQ